jgi:hypothetical protein
LKKLRTQGQSQSRGLGWLLEKVEQLLKERQEQLSRLREQQQPPWPMPPGLPDLPPPQHGLFPEQGETPQRNHLRHESPGASQRHESPHRHGMTEFNSTESPRHSELPPAPPWAEEWPDMPRSQDGASEPREPEASRNYREWLLEEWDFEDIPPPRHLLEGRENPPRRAPHMPEWPPIAPWDAPPNSNRRAQDSEEFSQLTDERKEEERAKENTAKSGGRRSRRQRRKKR